MHFGIGFCGLREGEHEWDLWEWQFQERLAVTLWVMRLLNGAPRPIEPHGAFFVKIESRGRRYLRGCFHRFCDELTAGMRRIYTEEWPWLRSRVSKKETKKSGKGKKIKRESRVPIIRIKSRAAILSILGSMRQEFNLSIDLFLSSSSYIFSLKYRAIIWVIGKETNCICS